MQPWPVIGDRSLRLGTKQRQAFAGNIVHIFVTHQRRLLTIDRRDKTVESIAFDEWRLVLSSVDLD